jgi:hypothetical protein
VPKQTRQVEVYVGKARDCGDAGEWWTEYVDIPAATPEKRIEAVARAEYLRKLPEVNPPEIAFVGLYNVPSVAEEEEPAVAVERLTKRLTKRQLKQLKDWLEGPEACSFRQEVAGDPNTIKWVCDNELTFTRKWLEARVLDVEGAITYLKEHGGYCDCEVVFNAR